MTRTREQSKPSIRAALVAAALAAVAVIAGPSATAGAACPNQAFRTGASAALPDCRAYEMVSPADKNGYDVAAEGARAAADGSGIVFRANGALPDSQSAGFLGYYLSRRGAAGAAWATDRVSPPLNPFFFITMAPSLDWTPDLDQSIVLTPPNAPQTPDSSPTQFNLYRRDSADGALSLLGGGLLSGELTGPDIYGASSTDLHHVAFANTAKLTDDAIEGVPNLYESSDGALGLVDVLPGGEVAPEGAVLGSGASQRGAVSDDGSRVVFSSPPAAGHLFVRDGATTVEASATTIDPADVNGTKPAVFWAAARDGASVLFTSQSQLTADANTGPGDGGNDLYRFDVEAKTLTDLTPDAGDPNGAEVLGVVGASDDAGTIYFVANAQLDGGKGVAGQPNLYVWHDGISFIATLDPADSGNWLNERTREAMQLPSRVSADGAEALITTRSAQPGFDNVDPDSGARHSEIYRYSAAGGGEWSCVSCGVGPARADATIVPPEVQFFGPSSDYLSNPLAGDAVYFNSGEQLVAADEDEVVDVYQWRDGDLSLISDGSSDRPSFFADADSSGDNVYFTTRAQLAPADRDQLADLYDARVGGGFAAPQVPQPCSAAACRGAASAPAAETATATATFAGPGNPSHRRKHARHHRKHHGKRHHKGGK